MKIRNMLLVLIPVLLFACTALKPVEKLTDKELVDRYYKIDLQIYMVKRAASKSNPSKLSRCVRQCWKVVIAVEILRR